MLNHKGAIMNLILLLLASFTFASELEVQGNLKVTGNIDAQNNPITNVGAPQVMTDAVNAQTLNNILTDDGVYEYEFYEGYRSYNNSAEDYSYWQMGSSTQGEWVFGFVHDILKPKLEDGWRIYKVIETGKSGCDDFQCGTIYMYILNRPIEGDE